MGLKSELVVVNTELSDSGYYQCVGENELGYDMGIARLEIYTGSKYRVWGRPLLRLNFKHRRCIVILVCEGEKAPLDKAWWIKHKQVF